MNIRKARLCISCDEVHDKMFCPVCGEKEFLSLHNYLPPMCPDPAREGVFNVGRIPLFGLRGGEYV